MLRAVGGKIYMRAATEWNTLSMVAQLVTGLANVVLRKSS